MSKKRVMCCGTFDYLHPGHLSFIAQAAALGDELYVVVARDANVHRIKGHLPDHREDDRRAALARMSEVDDVRLGYSGQNLLRVVGDISPHIIALGYDQGWPPGLAEAFPDCELMVLLPHHPEKYKSSIYRGQSG